MKISVGVMVWLVSVAAVSEAASVSLAWDAVPDSSVAGYIVRYGTASRYYTLSLDAKTATTTTVPDLAAGIRYYFAVQAYTADGVLSVVSDEIDTVIEATVGSKIILPLPGATLPGSTATFEWNTGSGVSDYWVDIGSAQGGADLYSAYQGRNLSLTISGLPIQGQAIWVRLYSRINDQWTFVDQQYGAAPLVSPASIVSPAPGLRLTGTSAMFSWSGGRGVQDYWLDVGHTQGGYDIFTGYQGTATSTGVNNLPGDGGIVWARLYSRIGSIWQFRDFSFQSTMPAPAQIVSPTVGSTVTGKIALEWTTGTGVEDYWLDVSKNRGGYDLYSRYQGKSLSTTIDTVPSDGGVVWVRLHSRINGQWQSDDFAFGTSTNRLARVTSPSAGSRLGNYITLTWSAAAPATDYWLDAGTARGAYDLFSGYMSNRLNDTITGIPATASQIWIRLYTRVNDEWEYLDYSFKVQQ